MIIYIRLTSKSDYLFRFYRKIKDGAAIKKEAEQEWKEKNPYSKTKCSVVQHSTVQYFKSVHYYIVQYTVIPSIIVQ